MIITSHSKVPFRVVLETLSILMAPFHHLLKQNKMSSNEILIQENELQFLDKQDVLQKKQKAWWTNDLQALNL